jgi:hypothetical protein
MRGEIVAAFLQSLRAVIERALISIQVCSALRSILRMLFSAFARMSDSLLSEQRGSNNTGQLHVKE